MYSIDKKRRSLSTKTAESSEPPIKCCRITEENCRSAKIIENERRLSDLPKCSTSVPDVNIYNDPSNFLSCGCLGSPRQVWHALCDSQSKLDERTAEGKRAKLCEYMNYRRETYHRAVDLFDRIMTIFDFKNSAKTDINFIGIFVVFIASKLEERQKNHWTAIADYIRRVSPSDHLETQNIFELEMRIITSLNWSLRTITALEWAKIYTHMARVYTIYKRICNLSLAHQSTPTKKRTKIPFGISDDEEVDFFTWAQLDDLVIGEPSYSGDWNNRIAIAQVLDLCTIDIYSFNFTYRQLGAATCISVLGLDYEIAARITGLEIKDLRPAVDFVNSYRKIYMKHVHEDGVSLATINKDKPVYNLEESENEEIEVMGNRDEASRIPESVQNVKNVPSKVSTAKVLFPASKLIPKDKPSREIVKTSVITDEVSESMEETSKKQGPSNVSPEFIRKSTIFISDSEVSLLEINVNSPSFQDISMEANIPKQQRLRILSPGSRNERGIRHSIEAILSKKKYTSSAMVTDISSHPPPQVFVSQASSATNKAVGKRCTKIIEMECDCGCGRRNIIDDKFELEKLINSLTYQKGKGKTVARLYITKRNQRGETEARREIAVPHPIEVLEKEMAKYYTQSFPLEVQKLRRVVRRLQQFWLACESRQPCKRRYSHPTRENRHEDANQQRRKSR